MDRHTRKRLKQQVRGLERAAAVRAFPLAVEELDALFDMLDAELPLHGCDNTRRLTHAWLVRRGHAPEVVGSWLEEHGNCDCEVLANVEGHVADAVR